MVRLLENRHSGLRAGRMFSVVFLRYLEQISIRFGLCFRMCRKGRVV